MSARAVLLAAACVVAAGCSAPPQPSFADLRAEQYNRAGVEALRRGDLDAAALHFERALESARALDDRAAEVDALNNLGAVHETLGDRERALELYDGALAVLDSGAREFVAGDDWHPRGALATYLNRSRLLLAAGRVGEADAQLALASEVGADLGTRAARAAVQRQRAILSETLGDRGSALAEAAEAARLYGASERSWESLAGDCDVRLILGRCYLADDDPAAAVREFKQAERLAKEISDRTLIALALEGTGDALLALGHADDARVHYTAAFEVNARIPHLERARRNLVELRGLAAATGGAENRLAELAALEQALRALEDAARDQMPQSLD
jgi:tetratricopeptide (TPR) repeat protein